MNHFRSLLVATFLLLVSGCGPKTVPMPEVEDPAFSKVWGVELGMRASELLALRPSLEGSPGGQYRESWGLGWITYAFSTVFDGNGRTERPEDPTGALDQNRHFRPPPPGARLRGVQWHTEIRDSLIAKRRWSELFQGIGSVFSTPPACTQISRFRLRALRASWMEQPSVSLTYVITRSGDGQSHVSELVMVVQDLPVTNAPNLHIPIECPGVSG